MLRRRARERQERSETEGRRGRATGWLRRLRLIWLPALLMAFAPQLLSMTGTLDWMLGRATADLPGSLELGDIHLAWWRPVQVEHVRLSDADGQPLAAAGVVRSDRSLWRLLVALGGDLGVIHVDRPEAWVALRPGGSNWETYLASIPWPESDSDASPPAVQVRVEQGVIHLTDDAGRSEDVEPIEAWVHLPSDTATPLTFAALAHHVPSASTSGGQGGQVRVQGSWPMSGGPEAGGDGQIDLDALPMELARFAAVRLGRPIAVGGAASGTCRVQLRPDNPQLIEQLSAELTVTSLELELAGGAESGSAGSETIRIPVIELELRAGERDGLTVLEHCVVRSEALRAELTGRLPVGGGSIGALITSLTEPSFECRGQVDLARLAEQAPRSMRLRDGVQLESGTLTWQFAGQPSMPLSRRVKGHIQSQNLLARRGAEQYRLDDAVDLTLELGVDRLGLFADRVQLRAPALQLDAQGRWQEGALRLEADLERLSRELGQFVDLGPRAFRGRVDGQARWETTAEQAWQVVGELQATELQVAGPHGAAIDPQLRLDFNGKGRFGTWRLAELSAATLTCAAADDELFVQLLSPVAEPGAASQWPLEVRLRGELARWQSRLGWIVPDLPRLSGQIALRTQVDAGPSVIQARPLEATMENVELVLAGRSAGDTSAPEAGRSGGPEPRRIREAKVQLAGEVMYRPAEREVRSEAFTLASTSASLKAEQLRLVAGPVPQLEGVFHLRGDLERLGDRLGLGTTHRTRGELIGQGRLASKEGGWSVELESRITDFQWDLRRTDVVRPAAAADSALYRPLWREPQVQIALAGSWHSDQRQWSVTRAACQSESLALQLNGTLDMSKEQWVADVRGRSNLNGEALSERLQPWTGDRVRLAGTVERPFWFKGPIVVSEAESGRGALVPAESTGQFGLGWQSIQAYGVQGGAATLDGQLSQQTLRIGTLEIPVSQGTLRLTPTLELFGPLRLTLEKGRVIEQVSITPEMCQQWLKYLAPLVAEATAAEGQLSLQVARAELPLRQPWQAAAGGSLTIHQAYIGPGPLARELMMLAQTILAVVDQGAAQPRSFSGDARWIELPEQAVPFRVENGQVAHQNLTMQIGEVTIRTRGWVGFDQRLNLVAEIPVQERWIAKQPYLAGLRGQVLSVPIRGTFDRPALDQRALASLSQQTLRGAAQGVLQQELQRQLERLFPAPSQ